MSIQRGMISGTGEFTLWNITIAPEINGFKLPEKSFSIRADLCSGSDSNGNGIGGGGGGLLQSGQAGAAGDRAERIKNKCAKFGAMQTFVALSAFTALLALVFSLAASVSACLCVARRVCVGVATLGAAVWSALACAFAIAAVANLMSLSEHKPGSHVGPGARSTGFLAVCAFLAFVSELVSWFLSRCADKATPTPAAQGAVEHKVDLDDAI